jgi:hypothetical protein
MECGRMTGFHGEKYITRRDLVGESLSERHYSDVGVDARILLKRILRK